MAPIARPSRVNDFCALRIPSPKILRRQMDASKPGIDSVDRDVVGSAQHRLTVLGDADRDLRDVLRLDDRRQRRSFSGEHAKRPKNLAVTEPEFLLRAREPIEQRLEIRRSFFDLGETISRISLG